MTDAEITPVEAEAEFWKALKHSNTGMLGLDRPGYHSQPMTAFRDEETAAIWFFTRDDTELARDVGAGQDAMFTYGSKDQQIWACFQGRLSRQHDAAVIERHWNPVVAAWYPEGKDDPHLTLLRFDDADGRVWVSRKGALGFFYEVAKANLTKTTPDAGGVVDVSLG